LPRPRRHWTKPRRSMPARLKPLKPSVQPSKSARRPRTPCGDHRSKNWKPRCAGHANRDRVAWCRSQDPFPDRIRAPASSDAPRSRVMTPSGALGRSG
jgi:hypothetical protein